ncbi:Ima1 N-terminal domain-containing protein [Phlyctochytrium arcticum]|nr:Ima1 N-terminal domain-containing protein [Phlyctochytrium arcticum]
MIHHIPPPSPSGMAATTTTLFSTTTTTTLYPTPTPSSPLLWICVILVLFTFVFVRSWYYKYRKWSFDRNHREIRLTCFYCNTTSNLPGLTARCVPSIPPHFPSKLRSNPGMLRPTFNRKGEPVRWYCRFCDCDNVMDKNGDIASDLPEMRYHRGLPYLRNRQRRRTFVADEIFCGDCSRRQEMHANQMASWLPDEDDPDYAYKLATAKDRKAYLLTQYPIVCILCQGAVEHELKKQEARYKPMIDMYKHKQRTAQQHPPRRRPTSRKERIKETLLRRFRQFSNAMSYLLPLPVVMLGLFSQLSLLRLFFHGVVDGFQPFMMNLSRVGLTLSATTSDTRWFMIHRLRPQHIIEAIFPSAVMSCTISESFTKECFDAFATHRTTLVIETAIFLCLWTEFGALLNYQRRSVMSDKPSRVTPMGPLLALVAFAFDQSLNLPIISTLPAFWASLYAGIAFYLVASNLWNSYKIGYQWLSPTERSRRERLPKATTTLQDLGYQMVPDVCHTPQQVRQPLHQPVPERDLVEGMSSLNLSCRAPSPPSYPSPPSPPHNPIKWWETPTHIFPHHQQQRQERERQEQQQRWVNPHHFQNHRVPHGRPSPFGDDRVNRLDTNPAFLNQRAWPVRHQPPPPPRRGPFDEVPTTSQWRWAEPKADPLAEAMRPQTFFPREQSTGLEDLFAGASLQEREEPRPTAPRWFGLFN